MVTSPTERTRPLWLLLAATAACYAIGYPLALLGHSNVGWIFVGLGGPFLIALGVMTIWHVGRGTRHVTPSAEPTAEPPAANPLH